ncbi:MAG: glycoside hydrolase family 97 protein [Bacteroides sp.]|nr:glycoside hydrolase family 97 protein [Bacteroides sp.]MCM1390965.1 glycoside hydrolase family 97 protein [Bacteroides sp.]
MHGAEAISPDGKTILSTSVRDGMAVYSLSHDGKIMLHESPLGLMTNVSDFTNGIISVSDTIMPYSVNFRQDRIKHCDVEFSGSHVISHYKNDKGQHFSIEWLVGNNDVAFRYLIPRQGKNGETGSAVINAESTGFRFPDHTTTFITPQSNAMVDWKRTKPSYEEKYTNDAPMTEKSQYGHGYTFPALFHIGDDGWVLLSETGVDGSYCGSRLSDFSDGIYTIEYPMSEENNGNGTASPGIALPGATPWRTITVGKSLKPIVETVIPWVPLNPLYESDTKTTGKGTWSWIIWQDGSINYDDQVKFIDLAADMGYDHALIDNWWDTNIGRKGMEELAAYAQSKGTNIAVWYSSSGWWNDIVQGPTNIMSRPIPRKKELKWLQDIGVKCIKVDFFGGDKQETMRLYEDILSDAADYGISVIFHGCTLPRGWERLYPNYVGSEAVLASENLIFSQDFCDREAFNATLHPFIRNTVGCMEYGGTILNTRFGRDNKRGNIRKTSDAFQLATAVLFQNPVQNFALTPEAYASAPADAITFMKEIPTTWDETRYIDGYPGKYAVIARRNGDKWYIAGISTLDEKIDLHLNMPMLQKNQSISIYSDSDGKELKATATKVSNPSKFKIPLAPGHGFVITTD